MKDWHKLEPELFRKQPYFLAGCEFNNEGPDAMDPTTTKVGFTASGAVKTADFGMAKVATYALGPDIAVTITVEAAKK